MADKDKDSAKKSASQDAQNNQENTDNVTNIKDKSTDAQNPEEALNQLRNDYLYLKAEFDNYKKNTIKERSELMKYGAERLSLDLLAVLDIFDKALEGTVTNDNWQSFVEGVKLTSKELKSTLEKHGIKEILAKDQAFDPRFHDAMTMVPAPEKTPNTILEVFRKGYTIHDKVLRPSQVVVAKGTDA